MGVLLAGIAFELPRPIDPIGETRTFAAMETKALTAYRTAWAESEREQKLDEAQLADRIERYSRTGKLNIVSWQALKGLPRAAQAPISFLVKYTDVRQQG